MATGNQRYTQWTPVFTADWLLEANCNGSLSAQEACVLYEWDF